MMSNLMIYIKEKTCARVASSVDFLHKYTLFLKSFMISSCVIKSSTFGWSESSSMYICTITPQKVWFEITTQDLNVLFLEIM